MTQTREVQSFYCQQARLPNVACGLTVIIIAIDTAHAYFRPTVQNVAERGKRTLFKFTFRQCSVLGGEAEDEI